MKLLVKGADSQTSYQYTSSNMFWQARKLLTE